MIKIKNILTVILTLLVLFGCQKTNKDGLEQFEGELFLKYINFGTELYTTPSKDGTTLQQKYELTPESELTEEQLEGKKLFELLKNHKLLNKPTFNFSENNSEKEFVKVFVSEDEYKKIEHINFTELLESNKKVKIEFFGTRLNEYFIKCSSIKKVRKVKGITKWKK